MSKGKYQKRIEAALEFAGYSQIDGEHHKAWVIDQIFRALLAEEYEAFVVQMKAGEDGPDTYDYYEGIPP